MTTTQTAGIDAAVLNFDLLPDSAYVSVSTLAALLGVSDVTIRRRIADGVIARPRGILGLQRYNVGYIRAEVLTARDMISFDDPAGGFDKPLTESNYEHQAALDGEAAHDH